MPTPTYKALATIQETSGASFVTFTNIPNTYKDLVLVNYYAGGDYTYSEVNFNNSFGGYTNSWLYGTSSIRGHVVTTSAGQISPDTQIGGAGGTVFITTMHILDYATSKMKTVIHRTDGSSKGTILGVNLWSGTSAINEIRVSIKPTPDATGTISLYGIEG